MNIERRNAFLEAANMCESEILIDDPGTAPGAAEMRSICTAAMQLMARRFRAKAEAAGATSGTVVAHLPPNDNAGCASPPAMMTITEPTRFVRNEVTGLLEVALPSGAAEGSK